jgi:hypothetical protein
MISTNRGQARLSREAAHQVSPDEQRRLDVADTNVQQAQAGRDQVLDALTQYAQVAPQQLNDLKSTVDSDVDRYQRMTDRVNDKIKESAELQEVQDEVIGEIVGAALGGIVGHLGMISEEAEQQYERLHEGWEEAKEEFKLEDSWEKIQPKDVPPANAQAPWARQLDFYKRYADLQGNANGLLGASVKIAKLSQPLGELLDALQSVQSSHQTRVDYPLKDMEKDALALRNGFTAMAPVAAQIAKLLSDLTDLLTQTHASVATDDKAAEKEVWKKWISSLGHQRDFTVLGQGLLKDYLDKLGVWAELGVRPGMWFFDKEEILAVGVARANEMIIADQTPVIWRPGDNQAKLSVGTVPALQDPSGAVFTSVVKAIPARTQANVKELSTDILKQAGNQTDGYDPNLLAHALIREGQVLVWMKGIEDATPRNENSP